MPEALGVPQFEWGNYLSQFARLLVLSFTYYAEPVDKPQRNEELGNLELSWEISKVTSSDFMLFDFW